MSNYLMYILLVILIIIIFNKNREDFDGIGKGFTMYYSPQKCCKSKDCYPGMYLGNNFWTRNWLFPYMR